MKYGIIALIVVLFIISYLCSVRFGIPNSRTPEVTKHYMTYGHYVLFDENVECWHSNTSFCVTKLGGNISRDDICDYCREKWKWHYNK